MNLCHFCLSNAFHPFGVPRSVPAYHLHHQGLIISGRQHTFPASSDVGFRLKAVKSPIQITRRNSNEPVEGYSRSSIYVCSFQLVFYSFCMYSCYDNMHFIQLRESVRNIVSATIGKIVCTCLDICVQFLFFITKYRYKASRLYGFVNACQCRLTASSVNFIGQYQNTSQILTQMFIRLASLSVFVIESKMLAS